MEAKVLAVKGGLFEEAALLKDRETDLKCQISGSAEDCAVVPVVDKSKIESIVAAWTGIPVEKLASDDESKFVKLVNHRQFCRKALIYWLVSIN